MPWQVATMDGKHTYYLSENTVKAAKDLIADRQAQTRENGQKVRIKVLLKNGCSIEISYPTLKNN